jgi:recombination protein RecR
MDYYPAPIRRLIQRLARLPGIGEKTAERLALHLLRAADGEVAELARSLTEVKEKVRLCSGCFALSEGPQCAICADPARDTGVLCVVEQPADMVALEKSGGVAGRYHVLGGVLAPLSGVGPEDIRLRELFARVEAGGVRELILATGTSVEGESTAAFIAERLKGRGVALTRIASGVPMGGDLKYVDQVTLRRAMEARRVVG